MNADTPSVPLFAALLLAALLAACGGADAEDAATELADVYIEMADVIEGISDEESLDDARPKMKALGERMRTLREDWEAMAEDGEIVEATWDMSANQELMKAQERMTAALMKIGMNPALSGKFSEVMQEFGDAFESR